MRPDIKKAFDFISNNIGTLRLTKADHIFVDQVIAKAEKMITPEPTKEEKKKDEVLTPKK